MSDSDYLFVKPDCLLPPSWAVFGRVSNEAYAHALANLIMSMKPGDEFKIVRGDGSIKGEFSITYGEEH